VTSTRHNICCSLSQSDINKAGFKDKKQMNSKGADTVNGGEVPELNDISDTAI